MLNEQGKEVCRFCGESILADCGCKEETAPVRFAVFGEQRPQGSKQANAIYGRDGKPVMAGKRVVVVVREDNPKTKEWRRQVADAAAQAMEGRQLLIGGLKLEIQFYRVRPTGHFRTGKNAHLVRDSAPKYPTTKPDQLKLARAIEDALSGIVYRDDNQVVRHILAEDWGERYETLVTVTCLEKLR